jgi:N-acetylneuraminate lyase
MKGMKLQKYAFAAFPFLFLNSEFFMKIQHLEGLIAATFTPYSPDGSLNLSMVPKLADSLVNHKVSGAFICGTTGEGASLTLEEKKLLTQVWGRYNTKDFKVIVMLAGTCQAEAIALAEHARDSGLYGMAITAPYYFRPSSVDQLVDYLKPVAAAAPNLPLYFYYIPLLTNVELPMMPFLESAGRQIPNFSGIKYTHHNLMEFNLCRQMEDGKYDIMWGWDETMLAGLAMGAKAAVGSTYNYAAPLYLKLIEAFKANKLDEARNYQEKSIAFIKLLGKYGGPGTGKAIMRLCGLDCGGFRPPVVNLNENQLKELRSELEGMRFFEDSIALAETSVS